MSTEIPHSDDLLFMAQDEPPEISRSATIKSIAEVRGQKGPYHKITFQDGKSVNVFDAKQIEGLAPGTAVEYGLRKSDKGYWDLTGIKRTQPKPPANDNGSPTSTPEVPVSAPSADKMSKSDWADRDKAMRSMNALTNSTAVTIEAMKMSSEFIEPRPFEVNIHEAMSMVRRLHAEMMALHEAPKDDGNRTGQGEVPQGAAG